MAPSTFPRNLSQQGSTLRPVTRLDFIQWRLTFSTWSPIWPLRFLVFFFVRLLVNGVNVNLNSRRIELLIFAYEAVETALIIYFLITCKHFWETHSEILSFVEYIPDRINFLQKKKKNLPFESANYGLFGFKNNHIRFP